MSNNLTLEDFIAAISRASSQSYERDCEIACEKPQFNKDGTPNDKHRKYVRELVTELRKQEQLLDQEDQLERLEQYEKNMQQLFSKIASDTRRSPMLKFCR